jgi:hypothetical protein
MKLSWPIALASLLLVAASARADFITWSYFWSSSPAYFSNPNYPGIPPIDLYAVDHSSVPSKHLGDVNAFAFAGTNTGPYNAIGPSFATWHDLPALRFLSTGTSDAILAKTDYHFYIGLKEGKSSFTTADYHFIRFDGTLNGNIYNLHNTFANPVQSITLGNHLFTVTLNSFISPTVAEPRTLLTANVAITDAPEPASVVLLGLGLSTLGLRSWWRKGRPLALPALYKHS